MHILFCFSRESGIREHQALNSPHLGMANKKYLFDQKLGRYGWFEKLIPVCELCRNTCDGQGCPAGFEMVGDWEIIKSSSAWPTVPINKLIITARVSPIWPALAFLYSSITAFVLAERQACNLAGAYTGVLAAKTLVSFLITRNQDKSVIIFPLTNLIFVYLLSARATFSLFFSPKRKGFVSAQTKRGRLGSVKWTLFLELLCICNCLDFHLYPRETEREKRRWDFSRKRPRRARRVFRLYPHAFVNTERRICAQTRTGERGNEEINTRCTLIVVQRTSTSQTRENLKTGARTTDM